MRGRAAGIPEPLVGLVVRAKFTALRLAVVHARERATATFPVER